MIPNIGRMNAYAPVFYAKIAPAATRGFALE
jgi:hypothetical protein